ncbi:MAG: hypothetical protein ACE5D4_05415 [Thermodesulfobacteriota bacterium]
MPFGALRLTTSGLSGQSYRQASLPPALLLIRSALGAEYAEEIIMSQSITFMVSKIIIQKDEYQTSAGNIGETEFWKSSENQAEVLQFKRAIATCRVEGPFTPVDVELIVSLRAGYVRVRVLNKDDGHDAAEVAKLLQCLFARLHHTPGYSSKGAFSPMTSRDPRKYMLCRTYDSLWLIATLHEVKDEKSMIFPLEDHELNEILAESKGST